MRDHQEIGRHRENAMQSVQMLRAVVGGETYETVALRFGISRTAVGRRIKFIAVQLTQVVGVDGLGEGAAFVRRLRFASRRHLSETPADAGGTTGLTSAQIALASNPPRIWRGSGWRSNGPAGQDGHSGEE